MAFDSAASNLVPGGQNRHDHVFLATLGTGEILRVSQATDGAQANNANIAYDGTIAMSRDGGPGESTSVGGRAATNPRRPTRQWS